MRSAIFLCLALSTGAAYGQLIVARFNGTDWEKEVAYPFKYDRNVRRYVTSISMVLDDNDRPHISLYDMQGGIWGALTYLHFDGTTWQRTMIDANAPINEDPMGIALTSTGEPRISYARAGSNSEELRYASLAGGVWTTEAADTLPRVGQFSSLALDALDQPHIIYSDTPNASLKRAIKARGRWTTETIDTNGRTDYDPSIALFQGIEQIAYSHGPNNEIRLATRFETGIWATQTVDSEARLGEPTLALDAEGNPRISYAKGIAQGVSELRYAEKPTGASTFDVTVVDTGWAGGRNSLALAADGTPHISSVRAIQGGSVLEVRHSTRNAAGEWTTTTVGHGVSAGTSIALDSRGYPVIAWASGEGIPEPASSGLCGVACLSLLVMRKRVQRCF